MALPQNNPNPNEQLAWQLALAEAQLEGDQGPDGANRRLVIAWVEKERKKLRPADFPRYRNLPGEDYEEFKLAMDTAFRR